MQVKRKQMNEEKVLKKLNIADFRHLTKDKVITMVSMLDRMDPEVAKKALEQFPNFSSTMKDVLSEYKETLDNALKSNEESVNSYYQSCDMIISSCQNILEKEDLSFEEKKIILDKMTEIVNMKGIKDSENKKFILSLAAAGCAAIGVVAIALLSAIGGSSNLEVGDDEE